MFNTFGCMYAGTFPMCLAGVTVYGNPLEQLIRARARAQAMRETPIRRIAVSIRLTRF